MSNNLDLVTRQFRDIYNRVFMTGNKGVTFMNDSVAQSSIKYLFTMAFKLISGKYLVRLFPNGSCSASDRVDQKLQVTLENWKNVNLQLEAKQDNPTTKLVNLASYVQHLMASSKAHEIAAVQGWSISITRC